MKVLIAYDGSDSAKAAIEDLAHAGLPPMVEAVVLTVAEGLPGMLNDKVDPEFAASSSEIQRIVREARQKAEQALTEARNTSARGATLVRSQFPTWGVHDEAVTNVPHWAILQRAEAFNANLIVVGSRGHSAVERFILGTTTEIVLRHATRSVRIGRNASRGATATTRIVLGVDGSSGAARAVSAIARRNWPEGTEVRAVAVHDPRTMLPFNDLWAAGALAVPYLPLKEQSTTCDFLEPAIKAMKERGLTVTTAIRNGDPKRVLVKEAEEWAADCIFVGAHGLSRLERFLIGSVSSSVAARASCSVEVVRD